MPQRSGSGRGRICGIYTLGMRDPYTKEVGTEGGGSDLPHVTASIG